MSKLEEMIEQKIKDNRQIHDIMVKVVREEKENVSNLVLQISTEREIKDIIVKLVSMIADIQTISSLDSRYEELLNTEY